MTAVLLTELENILFAILTQLVDIIPSLLGIFLVFWFVRSLFFKE